MKIIRSIIAKLKKSDPLSSHQEKSDDFIAGNISVPARSLLLPTLFFFSMRMHCC